MLTLPIETVFDCPRQRLADMARLLLMLGHARTNARGLSVVGSEAMSCFALASPCALASRNEILRRRGRNWRLGCGSKCFLLAVLVAARQLRTALFAREIRKIPHTEASSPAYILGYMR